MVYCSIVVVCCDVVSFLELIITTSQTSQKVLSYQINYECVTLQYVIDYH